MPKAVNTVATFRDLLQIFDRTALASDIGISPNTIASWLRRDRIPVHWWEKVCDAALVQGLTGVTFARLRRIEQKHSEERTAVKTAPQRRGAVYVGKYPGVVQVAKTTRTPTGTRGPSDVARNYLQHGQ